jgi:hypothetical protein
MVVLGKQLRLTQTTQNVLQRVLRVVAKNLVQIFDGYLDVSAHA